MSKRKASEIPRNEAYAKGIRHKAQGSKKEMIFALPCALSPVPCALRPAPHSYTAVTRDVGNAADGRFQTASLGHFVLQPILPQ